MTIDMTGDKKQWHLPVPGFERLSLTPTTSTLHEILRRHLFTHKMRFTLATVFALVAAVSAQSLGDISVCASNCSTSAIPDSGCGTM